MNHNKQKEYTYYDQNTDNRKTSGHIFRILCLQFLQLSFQQLGILFCGQIFIIYNLQTRKNISLIGSICRIVGIQPFVSALVNTVHIIKVFIFSGQIFLLRQIQLPCLDYFTVDLQRCLIIAKIHPGTAKRIQQVKVFSLHSLKFDPVTEALCLRIIYIPVRSCLIIIIGQIYDIKFNIIGFCHLNGIIPESHFRAIKAIRNHIIRKALINIKMRLINIQITGQTIIQSFNRSQSFRIFGCSLSSSVFLRHFLCSALGSFSVSCIFTGKSHKILSDIPDPLSSVICIRNLQPRFPICSGLFIQNSDLHILIGFLHNIIRSSGI